jgi:hypothetical protein
MYDVCNKIIAIQKLEKGQIKYQQNREFYKLDEIDKKIPYPERLSCK